MISGNRAAPALVRIVDQKGLPVGFGLFVAPGKVVTCAHVVAMALDEPATLVEPPVPRRARLDFPFLAPGHILTAAIAAWLPMEDDGAGDVAGLELDDPVPAGAQPLALTRGGHLGDRNILTYGYQHQVGGAPTWVPCMIVERIERGLLQLAPGPDTGNLRVQQGFSGSPIWDRQTGQVVGLINQASRSRDIWLAYAVSGDVIYAAWPELREFFRQACPFRSLVPFEPADRDVFFGRDELARSTVEQILRHDLCLLTGASGAGKTSLLRAAVLPQLQQHRLDVLTIRPMARDSLWETLAAAVARRLSLPGSADLPGTERDVAAVLTTGSPLSRVTRMCEYLKAQRLVIVVDQFEELLPGGELHLRDFASELRGLYSAQPRVDGPLVRIVVVVRDDLSTRVRELPGYPEAIGTVIQVGPLSEEQLRAAVEGPVRAGGFASYEDGLVDRIIADLRVQPYNLPALQVMLTGLWERQGPDGVLRHSDYQELNGEAGPLAAHLDRVWRENLREADRKAVERLLMHLVIPLDAGAFARRTAAREEMDDAEWAIAGVLATARLIVLGADTAGTATLELVHDALIDQWPLLACHLAANRDFIVWRGDVRRRIVAWEESGRQGSQLMTGQQIKRARVWLRDRPADVTSRERVFLARSLSRWRRRRAAAAGLAMIVVVLAAVLVWRLSTESRSGEEAAAAASAAAVRQAAEGAAVRLLEQAERVDRTDPYAALQLTLRAYRTNPASTPATHLLGQQYDRYFHADWVIPDYSAAVETLEPPSLPDRLNSIAHQISADGRTVATTDPSGNVMLWRFDGPTPKAVRVNVHSSRLEMSHQGGYLAIVYRNRPVGAQLCTGPPTAVPSCLFLYDIRRNQLRELDRVENESAGVREIMAVRIDPAETVVSAVIGARFESKRMLKTWELATGNLLSERELDWHGAPHQFSPADERSWPSRRIRDLWLTPGGDRTIFLERLQNPAGVDSDVLTACDSARCAATRRILGQAVVMGEPVTMSLDRKRIAMLVSVSLGLSAEVRARAWDIPSLSVVAESAPLTTDPLPARLSLDATGDRLFAANTGMPMTVWSRDGSNWKQDTAGSTPELAGNQWDHMIPLHNGGNMPVVFTYRTVVMFLLPSPNRQPPLQRAGAAPSETPSERIAGLCRILGATGLPEQVSQEMPPGTNTEPVCPHMPTVTEITPQLAR